MSVLTTTPDLAAEESLPAAVLDGRYEQMLGRLSRQSVVNHFDAYADIDWDSPDMTVDPTDPRWELHSGDPLGATKWYQALPQVDRARLGLDSIASKMKVGLEFESVLKRGLLEFAAALPNGSPEFRYAYHEVIEEAQHSLMFQEFVNRSGFDAAGLSALDRLGARFIIGLGRRFPPLFFVFVLGGEDPIDHVQRQVLRDHADLHPLVERIMRIHVTEEARHLSFARHYLKRTVPGLGPAKRATLAIGAPLVLSTMAQMMLRPSTQLINRYRIPKPVIAEAFTDNEQFHDDAIASMTKLRKLWTELGLAGPGYRRLWRVLGLWPTAGTNSSPSDVRSEPVR